MPEQPKVIHHGTHADRIHQQQALILRAKKAAEAKNSNGCGGSVPVPAK